MLVAANVRKVKVYRKPKISLLASGDELISSDKTKSSESVFASSLYMLDAMINVSGAICVSKNIVGDNKNLIKNQLKKELKSDIIITTGGVSVGKKDLIRSSLNELGFKEKFWKIKMKPGKPLLFGNIKKTPIFSLPGNPVSSYVCFFIFILPYIYKLLNLKKYVNYEKARLKNNISPSNERDSYYRGVYNRKKELTFVKILSNQDSSLLNTLSKANCLVKVPKNNQTIREGSILEILKIPDFY